MPDRRTLPGPSSRVAAFVLAALLGAPAALAQPTPLPDGRISGAAVPAPPAVPRMIRAQVVAKTTTTLASPMPGRIVSLSVADGERFEKGQVLVAFDCGLENARLARAEASATKARAVNVARLRQDKLGSVSQLEVSIASAELLEAEADVRLMQVVVSRCRVPAPFDGRVGAMHVQLHQHAGEGQPLLLIHDDRVLEVELIVPSRWLSWLETGHRFDIEMDETGRRYDARVSRISGQVDAASQTVKVYAAIMSEAAGLLPGMSGRAMMDPPS